MFLQENMIGNIEFLIHCLFEGLVYDKSLTNSKYLLLSFVKQFRKRNM
jgi:hypothetical protein